MFRKIPFIMMAIILAVILLDPVLPLVLKQLLYSIALSIKDTIMLILPLIIFGLLFKAAVKLSSSATKIIGLILVLVCCSNFFSAFLSQYVGMWIYSFDLSMISPNEATGLLPLWELKLPRLIANDKAMFAGIILGIIASKLYFKLATEISIKIERIIGRLLEGFIYVIPLFVAGFVVKMQYDGGMAVIIKDYITIFAIIALAQFSYIVLAYFMLSKHKAILSLRNMLPAAISGFSTMSSAASMPLTIIGAENNAKNKDVARSVIPATVNIHLVGDCFAIPILAYAVLKTFGMAEPEFANYLIFALYFVLAKFSVAAVPGGGILVMLPILEQYLGFNAEMMSLITALYILFDPVITCANVLGNGAFAMGVDRCLALSGKRRLTEAEA